MVIQFCNGGGNMSEKNSKSKLYYTITFLVSTSYIWIFIITAYSIGIPQYIALIGGIALITAFTFYFTIPIIYIFLPLLYISVILSWFRIYSSGRMVAYYVLSCFILGLALFLPLKFYSVYEEKYVFKKQVEDQRIEEKVKQAIEEKNGPIKITYVTKESMVQWNEGTENPKYSKINIHFELLNCDNQKEGASGFSCTSSVEALYKNKKWLVDFASKENVDAMNILKNNQHAEEIEKQLALTPEEELAIHNTAELKGIQYVNDDYNLNLTIVEQTFQKHTSSYKKKIAHRMQFMC